MLVAEKEKFNWSMLKGLAAEFRQSVEQNFGEKRKWIAGSIAALLYLRLSPQERSEWVKQIVHADALDDELANLLKKTEPPPPGYDKLIGRPFPPVQSLKPSRPRRSKPREKPNHPSPGNQPR